MSDKQLPTATSAQLPTPDIYGNTRNDKVVLVESTTSLLIGVANNDLIGVVNNELLHSNEPLDGSQTTSSWSFNNLFHQPTFNSNDQTRRDFYEHGSEIQHACGSNPNNYTSVPDYFNYPRNNDFESNNQYTSNSAGFFPPSLQLPYSVNNYGSTQSDPPILQTLHSVPEHEDNDPEDSTYSINSSAKSSRSQSTNSSNGENPAFYTETKAVLFGDSNALQRSPFETFCTVPGRTSLLSSTTKYKVTVGEVQRRISPPECLNASLLGGILRKAKSKDGGKALRESLRRIGLTLPAGRRKSAHVTALTALVEEEAVHMAKDFHSVCERDFPYKEIAQFLSRHVSNDEEAHQRRTVLHYVRIYIKELSDLLNSDRSPVCSQSPDVILDPSIQKPLTHFSMVTHGFGGLVFLSVLDALNNCVHESIKHLDRTFNSSLNAPINRLPHNGINPYDFPT